MLASLILGLTSAAVAAEPLSPSPEIRIDDVNHFYAVYDSSGGRPSIEELQSEYLDKASPGLVELQKARTITADRLAKAITEKPADFAYARNCVAMLPAVKVRVAGALATLRKLYPAAIFPSVTIAIGRDNTGAIGNASGVVVGLEVLCSAPFMQDDPEDSFVHVIAHEYAHVQQPAAQVEDPKDTVLKAALVEGGAEFMAELTSGAVSYRHLLVATKGREKEIETQFLADIDKPALGSKWLYNGPGTARWPGDLGYWVGYRITKSYYVHARDKQKAVRDIVEMQNFSAFLAKSGWRPGMKHD